VRIRQGHSLAAEMKREGGSLLYAPSSRTLEGKGKKNVRMQVRRTWGLPERALLKRWEINSTIEEERIWKWGDNFFGLS